MRILVTGGCGFIGSALVLQLVQDLGHEVLDVDAMTYAANPLSLAPLAGNPRHKLVEADICDASRMRVLVSEFKPQAIMHLAAESHVDRSIHGPAAFIETNVNGTFGLLEAARGYWSALPEPQKADFRFLHVSTDEVYGTLGPNDPPFTETTPYAPNSPYSASKAASDHLVRAYHHTYGMPVLTTNCSNNYGPYHFPEKLIPLVITNARAGKPLPIYGDGQQVRDWLFVTDHCAAIRRVLAEGKLGEVYNVGGWNEKANLDVVHTLCDILDELDPKAAGSYRDQITYVQDRPGHDRRYAIDARKLERELGWKPAETFETGIRKTVQWYLDNQPWVQNVQSGDYQNWLEKNYAQRALGEEAK